MEDITIGSDHAGFELKRALIDFLQSQNYKILDVGTNTTNSVDYPDYAFKVALNIKNKKSAKGIMICGSGVGACVASNKVAGIRAGICHDTYSAHQGVEHDDMNVLILGSRIIGVALAQEIVPAFLKASFSNAERHVRRLNKVLDIEKKY